MILFLVSVLLYQLIQMCQSFLQLLSYYLVGTSVFIFVYSDVISILSNLLYSKSNSVSWISVLQRLRFIPLFFTLYYTLRHVLCSFAFTSMKLKSLVTKGEILITLWPLELEGRSLNVESGNRSTPVQQQFFGQVPFSSWKIINNEYCLRRGKVVTKHTKARLLTRSTQQELQW